jgi:HEAT repeat protein
MVDPNEFQSYLREICRRYKQWWLENALTETIAVRQATFSFEQRVQTTRSEEKNSKGMPLPIFKGIQNYIELEPILLVGSPGVGKSTALLQCLVKFAEKECEKLDPRIPVLVSLKRYNNVRFASPEDPSGILTLIKDTLEPDLWLEISDIKKLLFHDRRLILLLDGLNEMSARENRTELEEFRRKCEHRSVPLICTTRKLDGGDLGIKRKLEIQPLNSTEIDRFLQECIPDQKQKILHLLNRDSRELSRTPFVLWMLYHLFQEQGIEVETLGEAFRQFFQSFTKYKQDAPVSDERRKDWNCWLEHLAFTMFSSPDLTDPGLVISKEQAEKILVEKFGDCHGASSRIDELIKYHLLESISTKEICFHHQLIHEYYAAEGLVIKLPELLKVPLGQKYTQFQTDYLNYLKWREVIALMLGFVEVTGEQAKQLVELALSVDLMLGARLAGEVTCQVQEQTIELVSAVKSSHEVGSSDWLQVELLGRTRSKLALPKLQQFLKNSNLDIARRAAAWIGVLGYQEAIPDLLQMLSELDRWLPHEDGFRVYSDETLSLEIEIIEALGKLSPKDAVLKLREIFHDPLSYAYSFTQPRINKLLKKFDLETTTKESLEILGSSNNPNQISQAAELLFELDCPEAPLRLISRLNCEQDTEIHKSLINALSLFNTHEAISALVALIPSLNGSTRDKAAEALIQYGRVDTISGLISHLENPDWNIRWCAAVVLGKLGSDVAVPILLNGLTGQYHRNLRRTAAEVLGEIENDEVIRVLLFSLGDSDYAVRRSVAISLAHFNRQEAIPELLKALRHYYPSDDSHANIEISIKLHEDYTRCIRGMTHEMLMQLGDEEAIRSWVYEHSATTVREQVANALARFNTEEVINGLFAALHKGIKVAAIPLGRFGQQEAVPVLLDLLQNNSQISSHEKVIDTLVYLISIGNLSIVSDLVFILENIKDYGHTDFYFKNRVGIVLANSEHPAMSSYLPDLVRLLSTEAAEQASWAINSIRFQCGFYSYEIAHSSQVVLSSVTFPPVSPLDKLIQTTQVIYEKVTQMADQPKIEMNFHAPVENAIGNVEGDLLINPTLPQNKEGTAVIIDLIGSLRQENPSATDTEIVEIIRKSFDAMPKKNPQNWQRWKDFLSILFAGGTEFAKVLKPESGILIEVLKRLYEIYNRNQKKLPGNLKP